MKYLKKVKTDAELASVTITDVPVVLMSEESKTVQVVVKKSAPEGYVDLDLPSGLYWAKCNLGATKPEEYGLYFQWGATVGYPKVEAAAHSYWSGAPFNGGSSSYDKTYFASVSGTVLSNKVLASDYDAVYQATNGAAHMPTKAQFEELTANTISSWETINGVKGRKFISKTDSTKYIFIPVSGNYSSGSGSGDGKWAGLWSSSLVEVSPNLAWTLYCDGDRCYVDSRARCGGYCVRGVLE